MASVTWQSCHNHVTPAQLCCFEIVPEKHPFTSDGRILDYSHLCARRMAGVNDVFTLLLVMCGECANGRPVTQPICVLFTIIARAAHTLIGERLGDIIF
jgi:hypothetical protein